MASIWHRLDRVRPCLPTSCRLVPPYSSRRSIVLESAPESKSRPTETLPVFFYASYYTCLRYNAGKRRNHHPFEDKCINIEHHNTSRPQERWSDCLSYTLSSVKNPFAASLDELVKQRRQVGQHEAANVKAKKLGSMPGAQLESNLSFISMA